jgi:hypothetical protein
LDSRVTLVSVTLALATYTPPPPATEKLPPLRVTLAFSVSWVKVTIARAR